MSSRRRIDRPGGRWTRRSPWEKAAIVALVALIAVLAAGRTGRNAEDPAAATVAAVVDGDTIEVERGVRVRLVQIDAPEVAEDECWAEESTSALAALLPVGSSVRLARDAALDDADRYGRLLRYVHRGDVNVNVELVRRGAASVWFYDGERGRHAERLLAAARLAKRERRGLWGGCPATRLDPERAVETGL